MKVAITGASGFLGRQVFQCLATSSRHHPIAIQRTPSSKFENDAEVRVVPDLADVSIEQLAGETLAGCDAVVHLAAIVPAKQNGGGNFTSVNRDLTARLAEASANAGIKRFIYVSSAGVSGASTRDEPITESTPTAPHDAYSASKLAGEDAVRGTLSSGATSYTIIRPPLVYGPGAHGPLVQLAKMIARGLPLPFGLVTRNQRDMIGASNLSQVIELCIDHANAANEVFVVRDRQSVSTRGLIEAIARAANHRPRLAPVPPALIAGAARLAGAERLADRLIGDYRIDDTKARTRLSWIATQPLEYDLTRMLQVMSQ
jgi:nucleoside-diphosphate-sugar epimerase